MAAPKKVLWKLEPHTLGKHLVLRSYLNAWIPILSSWKGRILFIDGFAGPGEYEEGEPGSPQIAIKALSEHTANIASQVNFFFIEDDHERVNHLSEMTKKWAKKLPSTTGIEVIHGKFDATMEKVLTDLETEGKQLAPSFVMIDPFGVSGTPMSVIKRILKNQQCEVYISIMYEFINRFKNSAEFAPHLDEMFGCKEWRDAAAIADSKQRQAGFYDLYKRQLRAAGAKHIVHFDLFNGNRFIYSIFFATGHLKGCDEMKKAIWKLDPDGGYQFRGSQNHSLELSGQPSFEPLKRQLRQEFGDGKWHSIEQIEQFIRGDKTDYHSGHLKMKTLRPMEKEGLIEVDEATRVKSGTHPAGCRIKFVALG